MTNKPVPPAREPGMTPILSAPEQTELGLGEVVRVVSRRRWVLLGIMAAALALAFAWTRLVTPRYSAEALVLVDPQEPGIASIESVARGLTADEATVQSEMWILSSRALAERVIRRLKLDGDPEFSGGIDAGFDPAQVESEVIDRFLDRLDVHPQENSRVISVSFSAWQPRRAAEIVNTLTDEYLLSGLEAKYEATRRASGWLNSRVAELQDEVEQAESKVEALRRRYGLVAGSSGSLSAQELAEFNTQLVMSRAARAEAQARLNRARALVRGGSGATASEVLDSPLIQRLREQEAELQRRVAELSSDLGERHPRMLQLRAELADLQANIDSEVGKIFGGLENEVSVARARESAIEGSLAASRDRAAVGNEHEIELRAAEREAEASRSLLASLLARQKESLAREDLDSQQADARIIAAAGPPLEPSFPQTPVVLGLTFLASGMLGLLAILVLELLDGGFRSGEQVERATGAPSLGFIPKANLDEARSLYALIRSRPKSSFGEAVRTLNWSISLLSPDRAPKTVLITSAQPGEGKTSIATSLALAQGIAGQRVLLIDADTRRPAVNEVTGIEREPGLLDVLSGRVPLEKAIRQLKDAPFAVLAAGAQTPNTPSLLASQRMDSLLADVTSRFDLVVLDSPPVMAAADARILAQKVDTVVMAVRWAHTRRETVRLALRQLESDGAAATGVILTLVDARRHAKYSYGDSGAYTGELEKYYSG